MKNTILLNLAFLLVTSALAPAATRLVPDEYATIQAAIDDCNDGDVVVVATGTYTGYGNRDIDFLGRAITVQSIDPNDPNIVAATIINCQGSYSDPHRGFYFHSGEDSNSILDGLTITNGYMSGPGPEGYGGAIYCEGSGPRIINCIITANSASYKVGGIYCNGGNPTISNCTISGNDGGGIYCQLNSSLTITNCTITENTQRRTQGGAGAGINIQSANNASITNCTISGNSAKDSGGGINCVDASPEITNCIITGNTAGDNGGGIYCYGGNPTITNCTICDNSTEWERGDYGDYGHGGGIYCESSSPTISNCTVSGNMSTGRSPGASGICCRDSSPTITNCTISDNSAKSGGAGICCFGSSSIITNCEISSNTGCGIACYGSTTITNCIIRNNTGGGISCDCSGKSTITNCTITGNEGASGIACRGDVTITDCTISGNKVKSRYGHGGYGGGIYCSDGNPTITNCTISGNSAKYGGGIYTSDSDSNLTNCILWGNTPEEIYGSSTPLISYSDVWDGWPGEGNIDCDPHFVEPGYWVDANDSNIIVEPNDPNAIWIDGDYHLLEYSPCINAGDPNYLAELNERDIDGEPRVWDGRVDMGADEFVPMIEVPMKFTPQALNPKSKGNWVKAHFVLPEGFIVEDVDVSTPTWIEPLGIESDYINVFINEDGLVEIEAGFDRAAFCAAGPIDGTVTVIGAFGSGQYFYGTDTIKIITNNLKYLGVLASHWLEVDCGKPAWCDGLDVDQDSVVNFVDFAMFDGCCIEIIAE